MIPKRLQNEEFRFIKVLARDKKAFELGWQKEKNYKFDDPELIKHLEQGGNYGVIGGHGGLVIIDADDPKLAEEIRTKFPMTFTVKSNKGTHFYFICKDLDENIKLLGSDKTKDYGQVQAKDKYVVAPESVHPSGKKYEVFTDLKIATINKEELVNNLKDWIPMKQVIQEYHKDEIDINIMSVVNINNLKKTSEGYQGTHPVHGSDTGINFAINTNKNVWHCFRHMIGGGALSLLAIQEGIINCGENLRGEQFKKALKVAIDKGLYNPPKKKFVTVDDFIKGTDFISQCKQFIERNPLFFDKNCLWWCWDDDEKCWNIIDEIDILNKINQALDWNGILNNNIRSQFITALKMIARRESPIVPPKNLIQFKNKLIDINTGEEVEASTKYFLTTPVPHNLGCSEDVPMIDKLITEWVGVEKKEFMYEIIAYCLLKDYPIQRILVLIGSGGNGKGRFLELLRNFLGQKNVTNTDIDRISINRFETSKLLNKLACEIAETNITNIRYTSTLKRLCGGDLITCEFKNKNPFDFVNYAKLIVATNSLPMTSDRTIGFYRRWSIVEFPNKFEDGKNIIETIPEIEYENLGFKCINLLRRLIERGSFCYDGGDKWKKEQYEKYSNPIRTFINTFFEKDYEGFIPKMEFNDLFYNFLNDNGYRHLSEIEINKALRAIGFEIQTKNVSGKNLKCVLGLKKIHPSSSNEPADEFFG